MVTKRKPLVDLWAHIHCLGMLAKAGTFTAAAQRLQLSKASVSQRVAELEAAAGVPLVRRTTRSVRLTEAGQRLVDETLGAYDRIEQSFLGVRDLAGAPRGTLSVTAPVALGRQVITPLIPAYLARYPEVAIQLDLSDHLLSLASEGIDLAIRHVADVPDTHVASVICPTRSLLVATPAYLARHGTPAGPSALSRHNCLHYLRRGQAATWSFVAKDGREPVTVSVRGSFTANNSEVLRDAALGNLGIALLPDFSARAELDRGALVAVLTDWQLVGGFADRLYAVRPYTAHVPRTVASFVDYLREALAGGFDPARQPESPPALTRPSAAPSPGARSPRRRTVPKPERATVRQNP